VDSMRLVRYRFTQPCTLLASTLLPPRLQLGRIVSGHVLCLIAVHGYPPQVTKTSLSLCNTATSTGWTRLSSHIEQDVRLACIAFESHYW